MWQLIRRWRAGRWPNSDTNLTHTGHLPHPLLILYLIIDVDLHPNQGPFRKTRVLRRGNTPAVLPVSVANQSRDRGGGGSNRRWERGLGFFFIIIIYLSETKVFAFGGSGLPKRIFRRDFGVVIFFFLLNEKKNRKLFQCFRIEDSVFQNLPGINDMVSIVRLLFVIIENERNLWLLRAHRKRAGFFLAL